MAAQPPSLKPRSGEVICHESFHASATQVAGWMW